MTKIILLTFPLFLFTLTITAQDSIQVTQNTLTEQMTDAFDQPTSHQEYTVSPKPSSLPLKGNISHSSSSWPKKLEPTKSIDPATLGKSLANLRKSRNFFNPTNAHKTLGTNSNSKLQAGNR